MFSTLDDGVTLRGPRNLFSKNLPADANQPQPTLNAISTLRSYQSLTSKDQ
jgi:hypothetical protein